MSSFRIILYLTKPIFLLGGALTYAMGSGIAYYLGSRIQWDVYLVGQSWITILQICGHLLYEYFNYTLENDNLKLVQFNRGRSNNVYNYLTKNAILLAAEACLALVAVLSIFMIAKYDLAVEIYLIMVVCFLGALFYAAPPVKLETTGYGELILSVLLVLLVSAMAFLLQANELHSLLAMSVFPLIPLFLSSIICTQFPSYASDFRQSKKTLLLRLGWQAGMTLHNILILTAFLILFLASLFGLPRFVFYAGLVTAPLGLLELWQMWRIRNGGKPNWKALTINSIALFGSMAYLIAYSYWSH